MVWLQLLPRNLNEYHDPLTAIDNIWLRFGHRVLHYLDSSTNAKSYPEQDIIIDEPNEVPTLSFQQIYNVGVSSSLIESYPEQDTIIDEPNEISTLSLQQIYNVGVPNSLIESYLEQDIIIDEPNEISTLSLQQIYNVGVPNSLIESYPEQDTIGNRMFISMIDPRSSVAISLLSDYSDPTIIMRCPGLGEHVCSYSDGNPLGKAGPNYMPSGCLIEMMLAVKVGLLKLNYTDRRDLVDQLLAEISNNQFSPEYTDRYKRAIVTDSNLNRLTHWLDNENILSSLHPIEYHVHVATEHKDFLIHGEVDFVTEEGIVEIKCYANSEIRDKQWVQVAAYSMAYYNDRHSLYIYNPIKGELWIRKPLQL